MIMHYAIGMSKHEDLILKELNYNSYLKVPELLSLQKQLSDPPHHDEMFFIIIHQASELWFKQILHETGFMISALSAHNRPKISIALKALKRSTAILDLLIKQINLLSTLTPVEFSGFRDRLRPASGFQSSQFRELEFTFGLRDPFFLRFFESMPEVKSSLESLLQTPTVYDHVLKAINTDGYPIEPQILNRDYSAEYTENQSVMETIKQIYECPKDNYHWVLFLEALLDFDEKIALWRSLHILMVSRTIGNKRGTGGSTGIQFLQSRMNHRFFPEIWAVRNIIEEQ